MQAPTAAGESSMTDEQFKEFARRAVDAQKDVDRIIGEHEAQHRQALAFPKAITPRDDDFLAWIRKQPCLVSARSGSEAAHVTPPGHAKLSKKVSDYRTVPLTAEYHRFGRYSLHRLGRAEFERFHNVDLNEEMLRLHDRYFGRDDEESGQ